MTNTPEQSQLGRPAPCVTEYDPTLLFPLSRRPKREELGITGTVPFFGADLWTAYELSWLTPRGKPQVAIAHLTVPCETPSNVSSASIESGTLLLESSEVSSVTSGWGLTVSER